MILNVFCLLQDFLWLQSLLISWRQTRLSWDISSGVTRWWEYWYIPYFDL